MDEPSISPWVGDCLLELVFGLVRARRYPLSMHDQNRLAMLADMAEVEYRDSPDPALSSVVEVGRSAVELFLFCDGGRKGFAAAGMRLSRAVEIHMGLRAVR